MRVLHYKQQFCINRSDIFGCVRLFNTLEDEEKVPLSMLPVLSKRGHLHPLFINQEAKCYEAWQCSMIQKFQSIYGKKEKSHVFVFAVVHESPEGPISETGARRIMQSFSTCFPTDTSNASRRCLP